MDYNENELDTESEEEEDDDESGSSGSDEDESGDDDGSGYESVDEIIETVPGEGAENAEGLNSFSSDDDPEKESCPICLNKFIGQDLGVPESCDHTFCFECIKEWSKNINTCPIDRTEFNYIHIKDAGGAVLRKVKVSVAPKEPEASLEETPTLCEVCHSGDREDRLLLCDGCDVAYHCECLDPPLFYIPIEEWFCPTCSGVFDSRAIAGPSRSGIRRVIPRTRASETVRSRVQILRTMRTPRSPSTSQPRKTKTQSAPKRKKRRRRYFGKAIRKVVTLARTKKDMNAGQKGKVGARSSTVIVTYRRTRKRCKRRRRKVSKRSAASSKAITTPSSKQRIAMHLGIGKSLKGSTVAQSKKPTAGGSRSATIVCKLPLFGNKDQLMDFSENFIEDMRERDASATSASKTSKRSSTDACPSTSSGISLLDSIMAGQKILQAKSDKILIKTDGSLILKDDTKKQNNVRKIVNDPPSHTPMSIALAKQGVRTSLLDKNSSTSCKKHADTSKLKNVSDRKIAKSSNDNLSENRSSIVKASARSSSKLFNILSNDAKSCSNNERKSYLSTTKNGIGIKTKNAITSEVDDFPSFAELDGITSDIPSNRNKAIDNNNKANRLTVVSKTKNMNNQKLKICNDSNNFSTIASSSSPAISCKTSIESLIKREMPSDEKSNNDSQTTNIQKVRIKQETLSDEETNIDSWNKHSDNREQEFNDIITNIKKEPVDPDLKINSIKDYKNLEVNKNVLSGSSQENDLSDFNASQSIIDSVPYDVLNTTQVNKLCKNTKLLKVKEEIPSDTEDYSQSLILDSTSGNIDRLSHMKSLFSIKKEPFDPADAKSPEKENACHQTKRTDFIERLESRSVTFSSNLLENELPCTQAVASPSESEYDDLPCTQAFTQVPAIDSEDDEISNTQAPSHAETDSEDDEISSAQATSHAETDSEDDEISSAQAPSHAETDSEDDEISSAQAPSHAETDSEDDKISSAQAPAHAATDSEDDEIPCTQVSSQVVTDSEDDEIPRTQAVPACATTDSEDDDDNEDIIPCTQAAFIPSKICDKKGGAPSSFDTNELNSSKIADNTLPPTQNALFVNENADSQVSKTKKDFEFKKPSVISTKKAFLTENNKVSNRKSSRNSLLSTLSECELPSTQVATFCAPTNKNKDKSSNQISNNLKSVKSSSKRHNFDIDDIDDSSLPLTQVSSLNPKQMTNLSDTAGRHLELSNVHATQIYDTNSQNIEELTAPETQIFKAITDKKILDSQSSVSPSESFNLPSTQIFNISDTGLNACVDNQVLPHTQSTCSNSKELCIGSENNEQDNNICKQNMNEIISNIKQIVNSLSSKVHENENWQTISSGISNDELAPNFNNTLNYLDETLASKNTLSEDKNVPSNNSKDALPEDSKELSFISTEKESQSNVQSSDDSNDEEFSLEKFKESLKKSKPVTPKKFGIHKHLPQVIAAVPVKENVKIKPSNKRTFSFEEVVKLQKPSIQPKPSINFSSKSENPESKIFENCESDSNDDNDSLPATQLVETVNNKSNLLRPQNNNFGTKKHINQDLGNHLNEKSDFHSSSTLENDNFPAVQNMISEVSEKNSHLLNEKNDSKSINSNNSFQNPKRKLVRQTVKDDFAIPASVTEDDFSDLCFTQQNGVISSHNKNAKAKKHPAIDISKKKLMASKHDLSENSDSSVDFIDSGDLPATQVCNNLTSTNLVRTYKLSNNNTEATSVEIHQNNAFETNKDLENSYLKNGYASKRKNSFDEITKNKKVCNQIADKSHSKKNNDIDVNEQNLNKGCEKSLSLEIVDSLKENCTRNNITIKQEKDDFEFVKPSLNAQIFNSSASVSCLNLNTIKIEKVDPCDDFLPPTQAVNFNHLEDNSLPHTQVTNTNLLDINKNMNSNYSKSIQNKFLSPSKIKKEPCSDDDEISVIEVGTTSNVKVEEVILIDDDDVVENYKQCLSNFHVIKEEEIPSERINLSSIKKEKCSDAYILSESEPDMRSLNSSCEKSENFDKKCSKDSKKKGDDSAKSKHDNQNHKHIEPKKNKRNSPESSISKKDIKNSKDLHTSKEKVRKNSFDLHTSEEKSKRNSKDHHPGEKSKNPASERKNTNLKDLLPHQEKNVHELSKKSSCSKDSKPSKKEIKDSHKSRASCEKDRKEIKDSHSSRASCEKDRKEIKDSHNSRASCKKDRKKFKDNSCSKEKKNKIDEVDVLKSHPKSNKSDSASKSKVNIDKCGSLSKSTNSIAKHSEKSKDSSVNKNSSKSTNYNHSKIGAVADKVENEKQKHSEAVTLERKSDKSSDKDRRCSSEKENRNKNNKDVIIAVKSENKRSHNDISDQYNHKKRKIGHSLDSESNSSEDVAIQLSDLQNDFYKYSNFNDGMQMECDGISNRLSASKDIGNANELYSKPGQMADIKKITSKQDLKEEIANEVKLVLKPFYNTGLISKDDYKDIMRRAVPKIFMNCHKTIHTEKIRKLVLNYVSLLNNRS